jgi:hypothetical protein
VAAQFVTVSLIVTVIADALTVRVLAAMVTVEVAVPTKVVEPRVTVTVVRCLGLAVETDVIVVVTKPTTDGEQVESATVRVIVAVPTVDMEQVGCLVIVTVGP